MPALQTTGKFIARVLSLDPLNEGKGKSWLGQSKTGTPYIYLPFQVSEGPCEGQHISAFLPLSDKTQDRVFQTLIDCFNWDCELHGLVDGTAGFDGCEVQITVEKTVYEGQERYKVAWVNPIGSNGGGIAVPDKSVMDQIVAKYQGRAKALRAKADEQGPQSEPARLAGRGEPTTPKKDLPF